MPLKSPNVFLLLPSLEIILLLFLKKITINHIFSFSFLFRKITRLISHGHNFLSSIFMLYPCQIKWRIKSVKITMFKHQTFLFNSIWNSQIKNILPKRNLLKPILFYITINPWYWQRGQFLDDFFLSQKIQPKLPKNTSIMLENMPTFIVFTVPEFCCVIKAEIVQVRG